MVGYQFWFDPGNLFSAEQHLLTGLQVLLPVQRKKQWLWHWIRYAPILAKLSYQFADLPKVVPWIVLWKNSFRLEFALKLWSRRAAQITPNYP